MRHTGILLLVSCALLASCATRKPVQMASRTTAPSIESAQRLPDVDTTATTGSIPSRSGTLTLESAVQRAVAWHPAVTQTVGLVKQQSMAVREARAGYLPKISGGISTGGENTLRDAWRPAANIAASQMIFDFGKVAGQVNVASAGLSERRAQFLAAVDTLARDTAHAVIEASEKSSKPVFTNWLGDKGARDARTAFQEHGIPTYDTPTGAIRAFMLHVRHNRNQRLLLQIPEAAGPDRAKHDRASARALIEKALGENREWLSEAEAKSLLAAYGIPVVDTRIVSSGAEAARVANELGFPVALKILSRDITHKSDAGGVALGLDNAKAVEDAAALMLERISRVHPDAAIEGFTVQQMVRKPGAFELILGIVDDATFGPVILFGQGGTAVEVVRDKAMALPPLNRVLADDLISRTRVSRLLEGYRSQKPADREAIAMALMALGDLAADHPEVAELDINPLWADADGAIALDARVRVLPAKSSGTARFAIRPYPVSLESELRDRDGRAYPLRPIRPEDAPLTDDLLASTDPEDVRLRFLSPLRKLPRQLAARLTQIDYDREMAFVIFTDETRKEFAAVGRLSEDPDRERAEFAIIVRSDLHGHGLGYALMKKLIDYGRSRGVGEIFGHVLRENRSMLNLCDDLGFTRHSIEGDPSLVETRLKLG